MRHLQKSGIITLKALGSPIGSRTAQVQEQQLEETKFIAFFMGKKIDIDGKDLYDAKQKAITQLKVPKSKVGLLAVVSAESQRNQDFKFESVNEGKSYSNKFSAWFTGTVLNSVKHPTYGKHQLTPDQIEKSSGDYKNKLFKAIDMAVKNGDITPNIIKKNESVNEGKKVFKVNPGIGSSKYSISSHDGVKKHKDGSDFYDIHIFKNKVDLEKGIKDYKSKGFVEESINEENPGLWANIRAKRERGEAPAPKNSQAYKDAVEAGKEINKEQKSLKREALKSIVREVMQEEAEYQKFFQKVMDKAGKSIPSMSDEEKKAFFNKVDAAWSSRGEKNESVVKENILNEDLDALGLLIPALGALIGGGLAQLYPYFTGRPNIYTNIKDWWNSKKDNSEMNKIANRIKNDPDVQEFLKKKNKSGWKEMLKKKLTGSEINYLNKIYRSRFNNESVMKEGIWPKSKLSGQFQMQLSLQLKKHFKGVFYSVGYDLYHNDKKILTIDGDEDSINSVVAKLKSKIR